MLARGSLAALTARVAALGSLFVAHVVLARILGERQYGVFALVSAWLGFAVLASRLGFDTALVRYVAAYAARSEWSLHTGVVRSAVSRVASASLLVAALAAGALVMLKARIPQDIVLSGLVATLAVPLLAILGLHQAILRAHKKVAWAQIPETVLRPLCLMAAVVILTRLLDFQASSSLAMGANVVACLLALTVAVVAVRRSLPEDARVRHPELRSREWLGTALPLMLVGGLHLAANRTDILILGFLRTADEVGAYAVAARVAALAVTGLVAVNAISAPVISQLYSTNDYAGLQRATRSTAKLVALATLPVMIVLIVVGRPVLEVFGESYVSAFPVLLILLIGKGVSAAAGPVGTLMMMTGHQREAATIVACCLLVNITLNLLLIPVHGALGAAVAATLTIAAWNAAMFLFVLRRLGINASLIPLGSERGSC